MSRVSLLVLIVVFFPTFAFSLDKPIIAPEYREAAQKRQAELVRQRFCREKADKEKFQVNYYPAFFGLKAMDDPLLFPLFMGTAMAISALPVIVRIMMDLNLLFAFVISPSFEK